MGEKVDDKSEGGGKLMLIICLCFCARGYSAE